MRTITLPGGGTITTDDEAKAARLKRELAQLNLKRKSDSQYTYEFVDGTIATCTFVDWENLNLILRRTDTAIEFRIPVIDMGDGSLCSDYLKKIGPRGKFGIGGRE
jgi:hypothetical protein